MKQNNGVTKNLQAEVFRDGRSVGSFLTEPKDQLIIGSGRGADVVVPGKTSPIHAMLRLTEKEEIVIYDLGSDSGTFVNGKRIVEHKLSNGDFFTIAGHEIKVQLLRDEEISLVDPRQCLIFEKIVSDYEVLEGVAFRENTVSDDFSLTPGKKISLVAPIGNVEIVRNGKESVDCCFPSGCSGEVYSTENKLLQVIESGTKASFRAGEKCRIKVRDWELLLYWRANGVRVARSVREADQEMFRRSLGTSLAILLLIGLGSLLKSKEEMELPEASYPKTSYLRVTAESGAPEGESAAGQTAQPNAAQSIANSLAKILNKKTDAVSAESLAQAVAANGRGVKTSDVPTSNVQQANISGGLAGGVNTNAISAGLKAGGNGAGGSLNGFAKGAGNGVGIGSGFGGKGFSMNLGDDEAEAQGGLDKALIAAVVQANLGQIKHCYEKRLIIEPNLAGKIVAKWTIDKDGFVPSSSLKSTTMNSDPVETCILAKIRTWKFPQPHGGGQVLVSYPFLFKPMN